MQTTMTPRRELGLRPAERPAKRMEPIARLPLSAGQERALEELYCDALGGQEAADVRAHKRMAHLLPLRIAARALELGRDPRKVIAYYHGVLAQVTLACAEALKQQPCSILEASLDEQDASAALDREQVIMGGSPTEQQLLTVIRGASRQAAASLSLAERCQRELAHLQRRERSEAKRH